MARRAYLNLRQVDFAVGRCKIGARADPLAKNQRVKLRSWTSRCQATSYGSIESSGIFLKMATLEEPQRVDKPPTKVSKTVWRGLPMANSRTQASSSSA